MFLDIETTGLSRHYDQLTLIGYELGGEYNVLLAHEDPTHFLTTLKRANSLITFNGSGFDLPFLEASFSAIEWPRHHVDLRYACRRLGLSGGQKKIEKELRIICREGMEGVDGAMAVILWHRYLRGDMGALRDLIEYNRADVRAMTFILDHVLAASTSLDLLTRSDQLYAFCSSPGTRLGHSREDAILPPPPVSARKAISFDYLFKDTAAEHATIVGIDLTGSAARLSGFCVMKGSCAETVPIATDQEILARVLACAPDLVSIDSPLCLPVGRTTVSDDDPGRHFGIMRESERILKRRGINVYPCLIPSMQRLTDRGMRLAATLRAQGIATIECYPGAAQDIMGIPRKGAGKEWLQLGLKEFGIKGPFETENLTHDELDAITCSLVGSFHLAGYTEALGGAGEEPMIVPDLEMSDSLVVGISGEIAAGKTTAAKYLAQRGFGYTRISLVIDEVLRERGETPSRERHQEVGWELHQEKGQAWLCRRALEILPLNTQWIVIDGLRWADDVRYLRERFGGRFVHVHVAAPSDIREARYTGLSKDVPFDEVSRHPVEQGIGETRALADMMIINDGDFTALNHHFEQLLASRANAN